jgi:Cu+-exporting ATPase
VGVAWVDDFQLIVSTVLLAMSDLLPGRPIQRPISLELGTWVQLALAAPVVVWGGLPFLQRGWAYLVNRHLNMFTLIALGTLTAFAFI